MRLRTLQLIASILLAGGAAVHAQTYWSTNPYLDCGPYAQVTLAQGQYACVRAGVFVWLAAGGMWDTSIRVAAPASNPIGVGYLLYDQNGNPLSLDYTTSFDPSVSTDNVTAFALNPNQPAEVDLLGAANGGPSYATLQTGSVGVAIFCPDAETCQNANPQLIYSALPAQPWSLSVPVAWLDELVSTQWSAEGIDGSDLHVLSLVIYNLGESAATFNIDVFDKTGTQVGSYTTPQIPPVNENAGSGTYAVLLRNVIPNLPPGILKVLVDGGSTPSAGEVLQITGASGTTLQVSSDSAPGSSADVERLREKAVRLRSLIAAQALHARRAK